MQSYNYQASGDDPLELQNWHTSFVPNPAQSSESRYQIPLQQLYACATPQQDQHLDGLAPGSATCVHEHLEISGVFETQGEPFIPGTSSNTSLAVNNTGLIRHSPFITNEGLGDQYTGSTMQSSCFGLGGQSGFEHQHEEMTYIPSPYLYSSSSWPQTPPALFSADAPMSMQHQSSSSSQTYVSGYGPSPTPSYNTGTWLKGQQYGDCEPRVSRMYSGQVCGASAGSMRETGLWQSLQGSGHPGGSIYGDSQDVDVPGSWAHHRSNIPQSEGGSYHLPELEFSPPPDASSFAHQMNVSSQHLFSEALSPYSPGLLDASSPSKPLASRMQGYRS